MFLLQYTLTILTIVLIPLMLRLGKNRQIAKLTYLVFAILVACDVAAYFLAEQIPAYVYLAIITVLSSFFVKRK